MKSITDKYWNDPVEFIPSEKQIRLAKRFRVEPEIINIIEKRGVKGGNSLRRYLYPTLNDLDDPFTIKDMEVACSVIYGAMRNHQELIIWGDYDVDGVTSTCLLLRFFHSIGVYPHWFIPNRFTDGYGLDSGILKTIIKKCNHGNPVLITVDCGITNYREVKEAQANGCRVIITDHHEPGEKCIQADAVLNVKQESCSFKDKDLAGVGTAFYLSIGLRAYLTKKQFFSDKSRRPNLKQLLELVAVGTIADMVPLKGCNRILVRAGFEVINSSPSPGLSALLEVCDIRSGDITSDDIAFQIGPKINAAGRLKSASLAVELLLEEDKTAARNLAKKLATLNIKRKELCQESLGDTLDMARMSLSKGALCVVLKIKYNIGILGIVASQITEKLGVPVILVTAMDDKNYGTILKGSCRSVKGVNIFQVLSKVKRNLIHFGGHKMAAGITLYENSFDDFKSEFSINLTEEMKQKPLRRGVIDVEVQLERALENNFLKNLQLMEPFGVDNPRPYFLNRSSYLTDIKRIGKKGDHLKFRKRGKFVHHQCIAFNFGEYENSVKNRADFDIIFSVMISRFKQNVKWQANVIDLI